MKDLHYDNTVENMKKVVKGQFDKKYSATDLEVNLFENSVIHLCNAFCKIWKKKDKNIFFENTSVDYKFVELLNEVKFSNTKKQLSIDGLNQHLHKLC